MLTDLRVAARGLRKTPGFSSTALAALALGIGANAAIFSVVNQVLLNPAGVSHPESVVALRAKYDKLNLKSIPVSVPDFADVRDSRSIFEHTAIVQGGDFNYAGGNAPERLQGAQVSVEWFNVFGARPLLGRTFQPQEDQPEANRVVVLSYAAWQRLFGGDPQVLGRSMSLNDRIYRVVGVMGREFRWPREAELWTPLGLPQTAYSPNNRFNESYTGFARMQAGVPFQRSNAYIQVLADNMKKAPGQGPAYARDSGWGMFAVPLTDYIAGDTKKPLLILLGAVGFVLLIACSNIAGLMLARTTGRAREIAVRVALGASRWQLLRQTLSESLLLAVGGAVAGLGLAYAGVRVLLVMAPEGTAAGLTGGIDVAVLLFTAGAAMVSAVLFGLAPAWQIGRTGPGIILKGGGGRAGTSSRGRQRLRSALVVSETALALVLLVGAGLFLRSLAHLEDLTPGFQARGVMTAALTLPASRYPDDARRIAFYRTVTDRLAAAPGVTAAAMGLPLPFSGMDSSASFTIQEHPTGPGDPGPHGDLRRVSPDYFRALGIPLKAGRTFTDQDRAETQLVALVDENLARQYWPGANPIGQHIRGGVSGSDFATIVGVVGHVHHSELASDSGKGVYYYSMWQRADPFTLIAMKTTGDPAAFGAAIRDAVSAADPAQPVHDLKTMTDLVENSLAPRRFVVRLLSFFAFTALFLAALGLYGVIGYSVTQRTQEIGIRVALGAQQRQVLSLVVGQGVRLAAVGTAIGLAAALMLGSWLQTQLAGVSAFDPITLAVAAAVLIGAAMLASYLPARRASGIDPSEALRWE